MTERRLDRIHIRDLAVECIVGVNPDERVRKQLIMINVTMHADLSKPCHSDALADTIDYKAVKQAILKEVESSQFHLIERLSERIAEIALGFPIERVDVSIDKPGALRYARSVAVDISRARK